MNVDRIAQQMVNVEPSAGLEARIRARLDEARPARTAAWWTWRVGAPLAAAAALWLAFVVQGPESRSPEVASTSTVRSVPSAPPVPSVPSAQPVPSAPSAPPARHYTRQRSGNQSLTEVELAWMERRLPALDPLNALQMDHLRVDSIQPDPLTITPLTMTMLGADGAGVERRND